MSIRPWSKRLLRTLYYSRIFVTLFLMFFCSCSATGNRCLSNDKEKAIPLYVVKIEGHTGLIFNSAHMNQESLPEIADLPNMDFYKIGWGDFDYYQTSEPSSWLGLKALFWPTDAAIHLVGIDTSLERFFPSEQMIELPLSEDSYYKVIDFINSSFKRNGADKASATKSNKYYHSYFYPATGTFYMFRTCNTWIAEALNAGGCKFTHPPISANSLFEQLKLLRYQKITATRVE